ncbi:MAG: DUF3365 domain-containing protein [Phormidesmis sp. RL_2_1]|nr:DUF3365 domain-containing protein [Phormidesmis sp. RL_2_1]
MKLGNLGTKFSLLLALIWLIGGSVTIFTLSRHLNAQAEQTVRERAEIVLTAMQAARDYTQDNIQPLVEAYSVADNTFTQEIIPNFAARSIFSNFRQQDPSLLDYLYKEAAVNPTNTSDLADSFEAALYPQLEPLTDTPSETVSGYRMLNEQKFFYLARPLVVNDESCLVCHGNPQDAPMPLINMYGDRNGFGWNLNEIVATQVVYVPADKIFAQGRQNLWTVTKTFLGVFGALFFTINLLLWRTVIRPLKILTGTAKQISACSVEGAQSASGRTESGQCAALKDEQLTALTVRKDEPGQLARAFDYMLYVLGQREQDLQQAVEERTQSLFQEMRDRQTAQSALQIYTHAMNHDLRNIAMGISSVVQGIIFRAGKSLIPDSEAGIAADTQSVSVDKTAISLIQKSCDRQLSLMDNLMDVRSADMWQSALQPAPVSLPQLTATLVAAYQAKCASSSDTVTFENRIVASGASDLPLVQADECQIQRVFENLIDNALKYNPEGVHVALSATLNEREDTIRCAVTDNGQGIALDKSVDLFDLYSRGIQKLSGCGYGLGLYICREIITAHGGRIGVDTSPGEGATFWFTLPIDRK